MALTAEGAAVEAGAEVALGGDFIVRSDHSQPDFAVGPNIACAAVLRTRPEVEHVALICERAALPRTDILPAMRRIEAPGVMTPVEARFLDWPVTGRRHLAMIFEKPAGGRLVRSLDETIPPIAEEEVVRRFVGPLAASLDAMGLAGIVHGRINPTNLFFRDAAWRHPVLGECVSSAVGLHQPAGFAPIEIAQAAPAARGQGQFADDLFGLGMTAAFLLLGRDPTAGRRPEELVRDRIEIGSFSAIIGDNRVPVGVIDLLRGLLADDPKGRWTAPEVVEWVSSRHALARQGAAIKRTTRPFGFKGWPYTTARGLAHGFSISPDAALPAARGREFAIWVERALNDDAGVKLVKTAFAEMPGASGERRDELFMARLNIALDGQGPFRYRGLAATIDGLGGALAAAFLDGASIQPMAEALSLHIPQFWLSSRSSGSSEHIALFKTYERLRLLLDDRRPGAGIERVLYELNPGLPCLSPLVERDWVATPGEFLLALEREAAVGFGERQPIDRHGAAFLAAKLKSSAAEWMGALASGDSSERLLGMLRLFVRLQEQCAVDRLPNLAKWVAQQAGPLIAAYHHRPTRERLGAELDRAAGIGRLADLLRIVDNSARAQRDDAGFAEARRAYARLVAERKRLAAAAGAREVAVRRLAGQLAATTGGVLAAAAALAAVAIIG